MPLQGAARHWATVGAGHVPTNHGPKSRVSSLRTATVRGSLRIGTIQGVGIPAHQNLQARHPVAHLPQGQTQTRTCCRAVVAVLLERAQQNLPLYLVKVNFEVARQRLGLV